MSVANQQASTEMRGAAPTWTVITGGAIVLILLTAALTWFAYGAFAPRNSAAAAGGTGAASSIANPALVEFRQGEQGASSQAIDLVAPNPGLVEFRQGEQGGSAPVGGFTPGTGLVEFRHGEQAP
jgi:hypothetical protein